MSPGVLTRETPCLTASPLLGKTSPAYPSGIAIETPVPTTARPPGGSFASSTERRSYPASAPSAPAGLRPRAGPPAGRKLRILDGARVGPGVPRVRPLGHPGLGHEAAKSDA